MSTPLQPRRSARSQEPRRFLAAEQALLRQQQLEQQEIARLLREAADTVEPSDSSECEQSTDESDEDSKAQAASENVEPWSRHTHDVSHVAYGDAPIARLPRHHISDELGFLQLFLTQTLVETFVASTNQYAAARQAPHWTPTTVEELWRYLAVRIRQGVVVLPHLRHYWQAEYRDSYVTQLMTRDRFQQLHRYFHIVPPVNADQRQTIVEKTAPFYHQCQQLFNEYYQPGRDFAVDETMIRFQGRSSWVTVIRGKPVPVGYKLYTVASEGYMLGFRIYRGRGGYNSPEAVLHKTVVDLVRPWGGVNRRLYFDNLYTSPALCDHLVKLHIRCCGTCRPNRRGLPADLKRERTGLAKGEMKVWQRGQLGCLLWHDSRPVVFLSTHQRVDSVTAIPAARGRPATSRPTVAVHYNFNKGHVDQVDQLRSYYVVERRTGRTWPALAWWLLDMCIGNAYKLWCMQTGATLGQLHFREQLLRQIAAAYPSQRTHVQPTVPAALHASFVGHWPKRSDKRRDCAHCSQGRRHRVWTSIACAVCGVYLCVEPCFGAYHDRQQIDNRTV